MMTKNETLFDKKRINVNTKYIKNGNHEKFKDIKFLCCSNSVNGWM